MEVTRTKLAALWTVVMFNMTFADIIGFIHPGVLQKIIEGDFGFTMTAELLLVFSVLTGVPIVMIFLSLVLPVKANRWVNTLAVIVTTLFIVVGGYSTYSYFFYATVEIVSMLAIFWYAWNKLGKTA